METHRPEIGMLLQTQSLFRLASITYGRHNLMSSSVQVLDNIRKGRIKPILDFGTDGRLLRGAAFIFKDNEIEVGRCANMPGENGAAKLMLELVDMWQKDEQEKRPLVAEIRLAAPFEGIAGGQGSQATLLGKADFIESAVAASFHHPGPNGPDRQEVFCFSSKEKIASERIAPATIVIPDVPEMNTELLKILLKLNKFNTDVEIAEFEGGEVPVTRATQIPFNIFDVDWQTGNVIDDALPNRGEDNPFDMVKVSAFEEELGETAQGLIDNGFQCIGISPPHEGPLQLLFGRLGTCLLAPTEVMRDSPHIPTELIMQVDKRLREQSLK